MYIYNKLNNCLRIFNLTTLIVLAFTIFIIFNQGYFLTFREERIKIPSIIQGINYVIKKDLYKKNKEIINDNIKKYNVVLNLYSQQYDLRNLKNIYLWDKIDIIDMDKIMQINNQSKQIITLAFYLKNSNEIIIYPKRLYELHEGIIAENLTYYILAHELEHYIDDMNNKVYLNNKNKEHEVVKRALNFLNENNIYIPNQNSLLEYGIKY